MLNPFWQPDVNGNLNWYGSGDANDDVVVISSDLTSMQSGVQNDMAIRRSDSIDSWGANEYSVQTHSKPNTSSINIVIPNVILNH